jgi:MFS family permease
VSILQLLRRNRNYRYLWFGQIVSEVGDHFNNIAVFALAMTQEHGGLLASGILISRAIPMLVAGPLAGVLLDRFDRRRIMIASDLFRFVIALLFLLAVNGWSNNVLFPLSALLMFASPFFTAGRNAILPIVAKREELPPANSLTQITAWATTSVGAFLGGTAVSTLGYDWAFVLNASSFLVSAFCLWQFDTEPGAFHPTQHSERRDFKPWTEFLDGWRYLKSEPLLFGIAWIGVGWATGGGAAQVLFSVFGEQVFRRGPAGIGIIWGAAGLGLVLGGIFANWLNKRLGFDGYLRTVGIAYLIHGGMYVAFALEQHFGLALLFIAISRAAGSTSSVVNYAKIHAYADNRYKGRVFGTMETMTWTTMMLSLFGAGLATEVLDPRTIGAIAGALSSVTGFVWLWAYWNGKLVRPAARE